MSAQPNPPRPRHRIYASAYDLSARLTERRLAPLRELVAGQAEGRVVEIGCGTGANFEHYRWARVDSLDATEPDPFMLRRAEARLQKLPLYIRERVTLSEAPAEALPFQDATFDAAVATLVLCTVADLDAAIAEVRRVLKPEGSFRLVEHVAADGFEAKAQRFVQPVYGWLAAGCYLTRETERALQEGGFDVDVLRRERFGPLAPAFMAVGRKP